MFCGDCCKFSQSDYLLHVSRAYPYLGALTPALDCHQRQRDRTDYPNYGYMPGIAKPVLISSLAVRFMVDACGLSGEQATRFDLKVNAAEIRLGVAIATRSVTLN